MNRDQFENLDTYVPVDRFVCVKDFPGEDRTLLFGYTCDKWSWHVYLMDGCLHRLVYDGTSTGRHYVMADRLVIDALIPDKRVYPESMDPIMAALTRKAFIEVPYTTFSDERYDRVKDVEFHGLTHVDIPV